MTLLSLFNSDRGFVTTDRLVYSREDIAHLQSGAELAEHLQAVLAGESERVAQAESDAREAAQVVGLQQGKADASAEASEQLLRHDRARRDDVEQLRLQTSALALEIVRRIAGEVAPAQWLAAQAARASEDLLEHAPLTLRVHPDHVLPVKEELGNRAQVFDDVVADDALAQDACTIESRVGRVDASLETQLERLAQLDFS